MQKDITGLSIRHICELCILLGHDPSKYFKTRGIKATDFRTPRRLFKWKRYMVNIIMCSKVNIDVLLGRHQEYMSRHARMHAFGNNLDFVAPKSRIMFVYFRDALCTPDDSADLFSNNDRNDVIEEHKHHQAILMAYAVSGHDFEHGTDPFDAELKRMLGKDFSDQLEFGVTSWMEGIQGVGSTVMNAGKSAVRGTSQVVTDVLSTVKDAGQAGIDAVSDAYKLMDTEFLKDESKVENRKEALKREKDELWKEWVRVFKTKVGINITHEMITNPKSLLGFIDNTKTFLSMSDQTADVVEKNIETIRQNAYEALATQSMIKMVIITAELWLIEMMVKDVRKAADLKDKAKKGSFVTWRRVFDYFKWGLYKAAWAAVQILRSPKIWLIIIKSFDAAKRIMCNSAKVLLYQKLQVLSARHTRVITSSMRQEATEKAMIETIGEAPKVLSNAVRTEASKAFVGMTLVARAASSGIDKMVDVAEGATSTSVSALAGLGKTIGSTAEKVGDTIDAMKPSVLPTAVKDLALATAVSASGIPGANYIAPAITTGIQTVRKGASQNIAAAVLSTGAQPLFKLAQKADASIGVTTMLFNMMGNAVHDAVQDFLAKTLWNEVYESVNHFSLIGIVSLHLHRSITSQKSQIVSLQTSTPKVQSQLDHISIL